MFTSLPSYFFQSIAYADVKGIKDRKRNALVYNQKIGEREGSDFISIELAGLNALKNLSIDLSDKFCN